jgi:site-specific recombinase XerD
VKKLKLSELLSAFLLEQRVRGNSEKTVLFYRRNVGYLISFLSDADADAVRLSDLQNYYLFVSSRPVSSITVQTYMRAVRCFLAWAYREGYLRNDLVSSFRLPKARRKVFDVLTDDEVKRLLLVLRQHSDAALRDRDLCICLLMLDSGLRLGEVLGLKCGSLHLEEGYISVLGKGDKERYVPVGQHTKKELMRYLFTRSGCASKYSLFEKSKEIPLTEGAVRALFRRLKRMTGIERLHPHLLRHTFATRYLENGGDLYSLQLILGHTTLEMSKRYVQTTTRKMAVSFTQYSPLDNLLKK